MKKIISLAIILLMLVVLLVVTQKPQRFQLQVINRSAVMVDQVRLWGSGSEVDALLLNLSPGQVEELELTLANTGELRFEVKQGLTRADSFISRNINTLSSYRQRLTIYPDNRFIISDPDAPSSQ